MSDRFEHTLEHKLESKSDDDGDAEAVRTVRRIELITGTGRRRRWPEDEKARIVVESLEPDVNVSKVARRHGVSPQQLFGWRRRARALFGEGATTAPPTQPVNAPRPGAGVPKGETVPAFASVVVAASPHLAAAHADGRPPASRSDTDGRIEIMIGDAVVRIIGQVESSVLITVLRAVRRAS